MPRTFRGGVERFRSGHNYPFTAAKMTISQDEIKIRRLIGSDRQLTKESSMGIDIEKIRSPFQWSTIVTLRFVEGGKERKLLFIPFMGKSCSEELERTGWLER